jgi:sorbitol/mannitol transport system permease protein
LPASLSFLAFELQASALHTLRARHRPRMSRLPGCTAMNRTFPRLLMTPAIGTLFLWMIVPLAMTIYFSFTYFNLLQPDQSGFAGWENYEYFLTDPSFGAAVMNTVLLLGSVIAITVVFGVLIALLINEPLAGRGLVRILLISPFFVMPTVNALLWKNMMMNPIYGVFAQVWQSMDREQLEASRMDGANFFQQFRYLYIPHLGRSVAVVVMIELIFLLSVFAEIYTTTGGGPGDASTNVAYLIFKQALLNFDAGVASAGALFAVVLANIVGIFMIRMVGKNLDK